MFTILENKLLTMLIIINYPIPGVLDNDIGQALDSLIYERESGQFRKLNFCCELPSFTSSKADQ